MLKFYFHEISANNIDYNGFILASCSGQKKTAVKEIAQKILPKIKSTENPQVMNIKGTGEFERNILTKAVKREAGIVTILLKKQQHDKSNLYLFIV